MSEPMHKPQGGARAERAADAAPLRSAEAPDLTLGEMADLLGALGGLAAQRDLRFLSYLLDMARQECSALASDRGRVNPRP